MHSAYTIYILALLHIINFEILKKKITFIRNEYFYKNLKRSIILLLI